MKTVTKDDFESLVQKVKVNESAKACIISGSMEPLIKVGEMIEIKPFVFSELKKFDVIVFWNGKLLICHYIWHVNHNKWGGGGTLLITRSLKRRGEDFPIAENEIAGFVPEKKIPLTSKIILNILSWWNNN